MDKVKWAYRDEAHRVWAKHNPGKVIPYGWSLHHIDGNYKNNDISNLTVVTHQEHWELHFQMFLDAKRKGDNDNTRQNGQACNFLNNSYQLKEPILSGWTRRHKSKKKQSKAMKKVWIEKAEKGEKMGHSGISPRSIELERKMLDYILSYDKTTKFKTAALAKHLGRTQRHIMRVISEKPHIQELIREANYFAAVRAAKIKYNIKF